MRRGQLTQRQLFYIMFLLMVPTIYFLPVADLIRLGGRWSFWSPFVVALPSAALTCWLGRAAARHGSLFAAAQGAVGPVLTRALAGVLWLCLGTMVTFILREVSDQAGLSFIYGRVPAGVVLLTTAAAGVYMALLGVVVMARVAAILFAINLVLTALINLAALGGAHLLWVLPLLPRTTDFLRVEPLVRISWWLTEPMLGVLLVQRLGPDARRHAGRIMAVAVLLGATIMSLVVFTVTAFGGPQYEARVTLPGYSLLSEIRLSDMLPTHIETLANPLIVVTSVLKVALFLWMWAAAGHVAWRMPRPWLLVGGCGVATAVAGLALDAFRVEWGVYAIIGRYVVPATVTGLVLVYVSQAARRRVPVARP